MLANIVKKAKNLWYYCAEDVWNDTRSTLLVNIIKTLNLTVRSFFNSRAQVQACSLTYRTILAIVPALAIMFAIGKGFGLQNILENELYALFPGQGTAIRQALGFVDKCLGQTSEGLFIGVGVAFLLWTVISLIDNIETTFNNVWGIKQSRNIWRKITDYTAIILILPILLVCGGGLSDLLGDTLRQTAGSGFMASVVDVLIYVLGYVFTALFFTALFMMVPNTKVRFRPAVVAGAITAVAYLVLQWLFVTGQAYVSRYNAIYGSFSFLPLFLLWMQFVWVICIAGSLICYASQNIFRFSFIDRIENISPDYREKVTIAVAAAVVREFSAGRPPVTPNQLVKNYEIPSKLVAEITSSLCDLGILSRVVIDSKRELYGLQPAVDPALLTLNYVRRKINRGGSSDFIPSFDRNFSGVISTLDSVNAALVKATSDIRLADLDLKLPDDE